MYRQGDVLIVPIEFNGRLPFQVEPNAEGNIVVMEGEATGHAHVLPAGQVTAYGAGNGMLLEVVEEATLTHEEHDPIAIPPGTYRVVRQREYSPSPFARSRFNFVAD